MKINNHSVEYIARGEFAKVYRSNDNPDIVFILTSTDDNVKEIYTHIDEHRHIPYMASCGEIYNRGWYNLWESRYYAPLTKQDAKAWEIAKILRETWQTVLNEAYVQNREFYSKRNRENWYAVCHEFIRTLEQDKRIPESITYALDYIYTWATAWNGRFLFEFQNRNLKVDHNGDLILLDIVFFR